MNSFFIFAGESSADLHGEKLILSLLTREPQLDIWGVGGPLMRAAGLRCILPMEEFQVMGFIDVFFALPRLLRHFSFIKKMILKHNPEAAVFIDYPGFNLRMEDRLRKAGYAGFLCHYICPSVWAWGKKRIPLMVRNLDLLLTIFPFEAELFKDTTLNAYYIGNPLIQRIPAVERQDDVKTIALFPGSRKKEIERNFPLFLKVAKQLLKTHPQLQFVVSLSHERFIPLLRSFLKKEDVQFPLESDSYNLMRKADLAIAKSGTVTLELALHNIPTVVTYGISKLDLFLAKHIFKIRLPYYCLVNILHGGEVFPELIGPHFTYGTLLEKATAFLNDSNLRASCRTKCAAIRAQLGTQNASDTAATLLLSQLGM